MKDKNKTAYILETYSEQVYDILTKSEDAGRFFVEEAQPLVVSLLSLAPHKTDYVWLASPRIYLRIFRQAFQPESPFIVPYVGTVLKNKAFIIQCGESQHMIMSSWNFGIKHENCALIVDCENLNDENYMLPVTKTSAIICE